MIHTLRAFFARRRFEHAFASELERISEQRRKHAQVRQAEDALKERVNDALRRKLSA